MAQPTAHDRSRPEVDDDDDHVTKMLKEAGCLEKHYAVQECMAENKDWRKCQRQVSEFKVCLTASKGLDTDLKS